ncbi:hypothetical protein PVK06_027715 [Gossypium arboreum]|uniref:Uncharacterized protein n=1 Tax=Gossypium arboreum TaxID=29729 RepID=A0ABR0P145_GOSAR|nr:hypothetical protein PVK06_027715 [Gossypium arboreum]
MACKNGYRVGCRRIIGLDGCFLKGYFGGYLLVAVGIDTNSGIYLITYAAVEMVAINLKDEFPKTYVQTWYTKKTQLSIYSNFIRPVKRHKVGVHNQAVAPTQQQSTSTQQEAASTPYEFAPTYQNHKQDATPKRKVSMQEETNHY